MRTKAPPPSCATPSATAMLPFCYTLSRRRVRIPVHISRWTMPCQSPPPPSSASFLDTSLLPHRAQVNLCTSEPAFFQWRQWRSGRTLQQTKLANGGQDSPAGSRGTACLTHSPCNPCKQPDRHAYNYTTAAAGQYLLCLLRGGAGTDIHHSNCHVNVRPLQLGTAPLVMLCTLFHMIWLQHPNLQLSAGD